MSITHDQYCIILCEESGCTDYIEEDTKKLCDHLSEYPYLTRKWNTDNTSISISNELLNRNKVHFDRKPLRTGM